MADDGSNRVEDPGVPPQGLVRRPTAETPGGRVMEVTGNLEWAMGKGGQWDGESGAQGDGR